MINDSNDMRRTGRTTRQIDSEIQELFETGETVIRDHAETPHNVAASNHFRTMRERLMNEHGMRLGTHYEFNSFSRILRLRR